VPQRSYSLKQPRRTARATLWDMWYMGGIAISLVLIVVLVVAGAKVMRKR
jgi:hypothetical protein